MSRSNPAFAAVTAADSIAAVRATAPLRLDPKLTDPNWLAGRIALAPAFENLTMRRIADAGATTSYLLYDDRNSYVGFSVRASGHVSATQTTNGTGFGLDDFVGIGIDPSGSGSPVYYFETTPRGTRYQQSSENSRFNPAWQAAAEIIPGGWNAMMIIPLRTMRIGGAKHTWRFNLIREDAGSGEHLTWAYDGLMQDGAVGQAWPASTDTRYWPTLRGVAPAAIAGGGRLRPRADVYGLLSSGADRHLFQQATGSFQAETIRNAGIDTSIPLTNTISFVGTLAPDFSNVEIDQQTIAPQEFAWQLVEYRPFFAQGAAFLSPNPNPVGGVFSPSNLIFYSPGIGPFDRGAKIEGTAGQNAFGMLSFRGYDSTSGNTFDDQAFGYGHARPDGTFSYWSDGVFAHHSIAGDDETAEAGFKGRNLHSGLVYAFISALESGSATGPGGKHSVNGFVDVHKPNYEVNLTYDDVSPNYGPLDGFTAVSDIRGPQGFVNLIGSGRAIKNWTLFAGADRLLDDSGAVHEADAVATLTAIFKTALRIGRVRWQLRMCGQRRFA
jgi:hypothetical protein